MKLVFAVFVILVALVLTSTPEKAESYHSGAPNNFSGPENYCTACHFDFDLDSGSGDVSVGAPDHYVAGGEVEITVSVTNTTPPDPENRQGFMISARDSSDHATHVGGWDIGTSGFVQLGVNGTPQENELFVTHTAVGNTETSWTFSWIAPMDNPPDAVTLFVAGNAANGNATFTGDYIYSDSLTMSLTTVSNEPVEVPSILTLDSVYPNPLRNYAEVEYVLTETTPVTITLYDALGRRVRVLENRTRNAGQYRLQLDSSGLSPGVYMLSLQTATETRTRSITVAR